MGLVVRPYITQLLHTTQLRFKLARSRSAQAFPRTFFFHLFVPFTNKIVVVLTAYFLLAIISKIILMRDNQEILNHEREIIASLLVC